MLNEQPHDLLAAHAGGKGQRVLPWGGRGPGGREMQVGTGSVSERPPLPPLSPGSLVSRTRGGDAGGGPGVGVGAWLWPSALRADPSQLPQARRLLSPPSLDWCSPPRPPSPGPGSHQSR